MTTSPIFPSRGPGPTSRGELDLEERSALRRVAGLSTELADVTEVEYRQLRLERVVLAGVWTEGSTAQADASLAELARQLAQLDPAGTGPAAIEAALRRGISVDDLYAATRVDPWFLDRFEAIVSERSRLEDAAAGPE